MDKLFRWIDYRVFHIDMWLPLRCHCTHWVRHKWQACSIKNTMGQIVILCPKCYDRAHTFDGREE